MPNEMKNILNIICLPQLRNTSNKIQYNLLDNYLSTIQEEYLPFMDIERLYHFWIKESWFGQELCNLADIQCLYYADGLLKNLVDLFYKIFFPCSQLISLKNESKIYREMTLAYYNFKNLYSYE